MSWFDQELLTNEQKGKGPSELIVQRDRRYFWPNALVYVDSKWTSLNEQQL